MTGTKLVIFDCDGTLVDSQNAIVTAMTTAFSEQGLSPPDRQTILSGVGLSLAEALARLAPGQEPRIQAALVEGYRSASFAQKRDPAWRDPPYPGIGAVVTALAARGDIVLGIATGKSRRGVARLLETEGWQGHFATIQTADDHPSKPHPAMIEQALAEAGVAPHDAVMIGDTSYDMTMAVHAGVGAIGVAWGYHGVPLLRDAGAHAIVDRQDQLIAAIEVALATRGGP